MKVVGPAGKAKRTVYGWETNGLFCVSPFPHDMPRRPLNRHDTKEEAEAEAASRNCVIKWETVLDG